MAEELTVKPFAFFSLVMVVSFTCKTSLYAYCSFDIQSVLFNFVRLLCIDSS